jgi:hypothetical protein
MVHSAGVIDPHGNAGAGEGDVTTTTYGTRGIRLAPTVDRSDRQRALR